MKKLIITLSLIATVIIQAAASNANLHISNSQNTPIKVILDGQIVSQNTNEITIEGIPAGNHTIQIHSGVGYYNSYQEVVVFQGELFLPANTLMVTALYNNQLVIERIEPLYIAPQMVHGNPNQHKPWYINQTTPMVPVVTTCAPPMPQPVIVEPVFYGPQAMLPQDFFELKLAIENKWFSSGKLAVVQQALASNYFTSQQVAELVNLFTFDGDKIQVSKMAYGSTVDPQNYFVVYNSLDYNSSVNELSAYIASL